MKLSIYLLFFELMLYQVHSYVLNTDETVEDKCIKDLNLDDPTIQATVRESHTPDDNENYGKFYICMWRGRGVMNQDGSVMKSGIAQFLKEVVLNPKIPEEAQNVIIGRISERCMNEHGKTDGQTGIRLKNCIVQNLKELFHQFLYANKQI